MREAKGKYSYNWQPAVLATGLAMLLSGCAGSDGDDARDVLQLSLQPTRANAGSSGSAALAARGEQTSLNVFIGRIPSGVSRPLNLLTFIYAGSCSALSDKPVYSLNRTAQTKRVDGGWRLSRSIPATLQDLRAGEYSLVLSTTPADRSMNIFCAEIQ